VYLKSNNITQRGKCAVEKIMKWARNHKKIMITLAVAFIILPIVCIHVLFKIPSLGWLFDPEWQAGDVLGYFGDVLSFVGTIILGVVAVAQTERANKINEELLKIEKNRLKPYLEISSSQLYKIYLNEDIEKKLNLIDAQNDMIVEMLYTKMPRTGMITKSALLELDVSNIGGSDIRHIFVKGACFYLAVGDPFDENNNKISYMSGNSQLLIDERKKLYIHIKREIADKDDLQNNWYEKNIDKLLPHVEFDLELETMNGDVYKEFISFCSNWDIRMKNKGNTATRGVGILEVKVEEKKN